MLHNQHVNMTDIVSQFRVNSFVRLSTTVILVILLLFAPWVYSETAIVQNHKPSQGYVPDAATAIKIAVAVWEPVYGHEQISQQKPYKAILVNGIWTVEGTLPEHYDLGGVASAEIAKDDGRVLKVSHGK